MHRYTLAVSFTLLCACKSHPCGDTEATAPAKFGDAPLVQDGGKICHAYEGDGTNMNRPTATVMYWGDNLSELNVQYVGAFDKAGWGQIEECPPNNLCFSKGDARVDLLLSQETTPKLGSAMESPSITVSAYWSDLTQ